MQYYERLLTTRPLRSSLLHDALEKQKEKSTTTLSRRTTATTSTSRTKQRRNATTTKSASFPTRTSRELSRGKGRHLWRNFRSFPTNWTSKGLSLQRKIKILQMWFVIKILQMYIAVNLSRCRFRHSCWKTMMIVSYILFVHTPNQILHFLT